MNAIAKTIRTRIPLISFTTRGFFSLLFFVALVLLVIYLPDITGIHVRRNITDVATPSVQAKRGDGNPLDQILQQVNEMTEVKPFEPSLREAANEKLRNNVISWDLIRSEEVRAAVTKARTQVGELIDVVPEEKSFSRIALANYQLALEQLQAGRDDRLNARDTLAYIRHLDHQVTERFSEEQVSSGLFSRWSKISLGDALQVAQNRPFREDSVIPFDPQLQVNRVTINIKPRNVESRVLGFQPLSSLTIEGSVLFRGVKTVDLYRNNQLLESVKIPKPQKRSTDPYVYFSVKTESVQGVYSFHARSDDDELYAKHYQFYPKINRLAERPGQNAFVVGRARERVATFDRFFVVGESRPASQIDGLEAF